MYANEGIEMKPLEWFKKLSYLVETKSLNFQSLMGAT